jgi:hypothetical protein
MDAAWFTDVLRAHGYDVRVDGVSYEPIGTGQSADSYRFELEHARGSAAEGAAPEGVAGRPPRRLVAKLPSADPTSRQTGHVHGSYRREVGFYREIRQTVAVPTPDPIHVDFDPEDSDFVLLLEDLAPARQGDQIAGCSPAIARVAMDAIAGLHAPRWGDPTLRKHTFLTGLDDEASGRPDLFALMWKGFLDRYRDRLEPEVRDLGLALRDRFDRYARPYPGPRCVVHGDYRLDNVLIDAGGEEPHLFVVDWQTAGLGCGTLDVAYFLGAGLLPEDRRIHEEALVSRYVDALATRGVRDYDLERAWTDYRWYSFAGYVMAIIASMLVVQTERGDEMFMTMAHRHGRHALDLDAIGLLDD